MMSELKAQTTVSERNAATLIKMLKNEGTNPWRFEERWLSFFPLYWMPLKEPPGGPADAGH